jgi:hypothetical protein
MQGKRLKTLALENGALASPYADSDSDVAIRGRETEKYFSMAVGGPAEIQHIPTKFPE